MRAFRMLRVIPFIVIGVVVAAWLVSRNEPPARVETAERRIVAHTTIAASAPVRPVARGHGNVRPGRVWSAVAEVAGAVTWRHPDLENGNVLEAGVEVLKVDPVPYELTIAQTEADLAALRAEASQIAVEEDNTRSILRLERERLALAETDLERTRNLVAGGTAPKSRADTQERAMLQVQRVVTELSNALALIPTRLARLNAQIRKTEAGLARARRDLSKTSVVTPFQVRIAEVGVQRHQFVGVGQPLLSAHGIARAEITAQFSLDAFPRLITPVGAGQTLTVTDLHTALDKISADIRLVADPKQSWTGQVVRVENAIDPQGRTVPVVVVVDEPYATAAPPERLPLVANMYVEMTLVGPAGPELVSLPDSAVHQGDVVYVRNAAGRLELREVSVAYRQDGRAILSAGIAAGEEIILDDLIPAMPDMIVDPVEPAR